MFDVVVKPWFLESFSQSAVSSLSQVIDPSPCPCCCSGQLRIVWRERERLQQLRPQLPLCGPRRGGGCLFSLLLHSHHQGGGGGGSGGSRGSGSHSWKPSSWTKFCRSIGGKTTAFSQTAESGWRDLLWQGEVNVDGHVISTLGNAKSALLIKVRRRISENVSSLPSSKLRFTCRMLKMKQMVYLFLFQAQSTAVGKSTEVWTMRCTSR